jgi:lipopolysaccharide/colanic/teichoic acid biosynthesis glycosyltransferase
MKTECLLQEGNPGLNDLEERIERYVLRLNTPSRVLQLRIKRVADVVLSIAGMVVLAPLILLLIALIWLESPGPAIFRQSRLGIFGRVFVLYKLRSMKWGCKPIVDVDGATIVERNDPRLTRLGRLMRSSGMDELPQLLNVLKGDMSLVGPRPDQDFHLQWYHESDFPRLAMRPGITSLGQVNGRNSLTARQRMIYEMEYVENFSLWLDLKIMVRTFVVVAKGIGAYNDNAPA